MVVVESMTSMNVDKIKEMAIAFNKAPKYHSILNIDRSSVAFVKSTTFHDVQQVGKFTWTLNTSVSTFRGDWGKLICYLLASPCSTEEPPRVWLHYYQGWIQEPPVWSLQVQPGFTLGGLVLQNILGANLCSKFKMYNLNLQNIHLVACAGLFISCFN